VQKYVLTAVIGGDESVTAFLIELQDPARSHSPSLSPSGRPSSQRRQCRVTP
jgi:hypothetical protein